MRLAIVPYFDFQGKLELSSEMITFRWKLKEAKVCVTNPRKTTEWRYQWDRFLQPNNQLKLLNITLKYLL